MTTPNVTIAFVVQGAQAIAVINQINAALQQLQQTTASNNNQVARLSGTLEGLTTRLAGMFAAFKGAEVFADMVREGFKFNEVIETATLGVASLITAVGQLHDAQGRLLEGPQALAAAYKLADDQVQKLRVDGIRSAATTEQLIEAFREAVASGVSAGLSLDQVRTLTVQIVQAAGALGIPLNQLNEEVRSLFQGTTNRNTRLALQLFKNGAQDANAMVRAARESGTLFEALSAKFKPFSDAAEKSLSTWKVLKSNIVETFQVVAGQVTKPLFEQLKQTGNQALFGIFDITTAKITPKFQPLIDVFAGLFGKVGNIIKTAIEGAVQGAAALSDWFKQNKVAVDQVFDALSKVGAQIVILIANAAGLVGKVIDFGVKSGLFVSALQVVEELLKLINTTAGQVVTVLALMGPPLLALVASNPFTLFIAAIGGLLVVLNAWSNRNDLIQAQSEAMRLEYEKHGAAVISLSADYKKLADAVASGTLTENQRADTLKKMKTISEQLIATDSRYASILKATSSDDLIRRLRLVAEARVAEANAAFKQHQVGVALLQQQRAELVLLQAQSARPDPARAKLIEQFDEGIAAVKQDSATLAASLQLARNALKELNKEPLPTLTTGAPAGAGDAEKFSDAKKKADAAIAVIKEELKRVQTDLDTQLAAARISYRDYFQKLTDEQVSAFSRELKIRDDLLKKAVKPVDKVQTEKDIKVLEEERKRTLQENAAKEVELRKQLDDQVLSLQVQLLETMGKNVEASNLEIERKYKDLILRLKAEGDTKGLDLISQLIGADRVKATLQQVETDITRMSDDLSSKLASVQTRVITGVTTEREGRKEIVDIYQQQITKLRQLYAGYLAVFAVSNDPAALAAANALRQEIEKIQPALIAARDAQREFTKSLLEAGRSDLTEFLSNTINQVHNLREAWRALATSILSSLQQVTAQFISNQIFDALAKGLGFGIDTSAKQLATAGGVVAASAAATTTSAGALTTAGGVVGAAAVAMAAAAAALAAAAAGVNLGAIAAGLASAGGVFFAKGGAVPGVGNTDSVAAHLTPGEFVFRKEVARILGPRELERWNTASTSELRDLRQRFESTDVKRYDAFHRVGQTLRFAKGGAVPGVGSQDTVPTLLTPGEYVLRKEVARILGPKELERWNTASTIERKEMVRKLKESNVTSRSSVLDRLLSRKEFHFGTGGMVPGQGNTDSVPAMLTPQEYVLRKEVVQQIGKEELDKINFGAVQPRTKKRHYATGGFVESDRQRPDMASQQRNGQPDASFSGEISLEPGLIWKQLNTRQGRRIQLKFIKDNADGILAALRLR